MRLGILEVGVGYNFLAVERDQVFLMPPSLTEWLEEDPLAWFVLDAVKQMDLSGFRTPDMMPKMVWRHWRVLIS